MEVFNNKDETVTKYLHDDGSETCIKIVPSCNYILVDGKLIEQKQQRYKYSVFISHSSGCPIGCKMCYLTIKKYPYHPLGFHEITSNVLKAIKDKVKQYPSIRSNYIKLCWMGMGDAFLDLEKVNICTIQILDYVIKNNFAVGLDCVDIGTVFPKNTKNLHILSDLNNRLKRYGVNRWNTKQRSPLRIFYSLHRPDDNKDKYLIPNIKSWSTVQPILKNLKDLCNIDVIFHQIFIQDETDYIWIINELKTLFNYYFKGFELRILRYNECKDSPYKESPKFNDIIKELNSSIPLIKYQISPGSEIKAACGQFLMRGMVNG